MGRKSEVFTYVYIIIIIIIIMKMYIVQKYTEKMKNEKWKIKTHMKWMIRARPNRYTWTLS